MGPIIAFLVLGVLAVAGGRAFMTGGGRTVGGQYQPGASGLPEQIFFWLFGAPRDPSKEANLSWRSMPKPPRPTGFRGRGASRRW